MGNKYKIEVSGLFAACGYKNKELNKDLEKIANNASNEIFGKECLYLGVGGSIPFMGLF